VNGRQFLQQIVDGTAPRAPIQDTLGFDFVEVGDGTAAFECEVGERHYNPMGTVHGGVASTLLDSALGCAVLSALGEGVAYTTASLEVKLLRAMTASTGRVRAEAAVVHVGKRTATAEGRLVGPDGALYATGTTTCVILGG